MKTQQTFEALSRMCLNNWHYIDKRVLSFHQGINFFTGHSGSGKSTVIDAMQIVLYANTDGRGFFNKAAADDSDRSLIEYLRGMVNIGENGEFSYLRNKNFSTTIVLELERTDNQARQCIGVVFDVVTSTNEISRLFFWHKGGIPDHCYRTQSRAMSTEEVRDYLQKNFTKDESYCGSHNERFRRLLYDVYLGGLDMEKFPLLFKRAIPFRMNIKLEDFVKEYICMEQDIHIEDMQESVMQYGRMRKKIEDTCVEIKELEKIHAAYERLEAGREDCSKYGYFVAKFDLLILKNRVTQMREQVKACSQDREVLQQSVDSLEREIDSLSIRNDEIIKQLAASGYDELKEQLKQVNELLERLNRGKARWDQTAQGLAAWADNDMTGNAVIWNIEKFGDYSITEEELWRLKRSIEELQKEAEDGLKEAETAVRAIQKEQKTIEAELKELRQGRKAYPKELLEARDYLVRRLYETTKKSVQVHILADLLDIRDETWRNAVEGYLGGNKLSLIVDPKYARAAMEIYQELDKKKYYRIAVLDTEKVMEKAHAVQKNALAEEVITSAPYVQSYIDFLMGGVMKCHSLEELRQCAIGITPECVLYHSYRLQYINPDNYTKRAYIGTASLKKRIRQLEERAEELMQERKPLEEEQREYQRLLRMESLRYPVEDYLGWKSDIDGIRGKTKEKNRLEKKLEELKKDNIDLWEQEKQALGLLIKEKNKLLDEGKEGLWSKKNELERLKQGILTAEEELAEKERGFETTDRFETQVNEFLAQKADPNFAKLKDYFTGRQNGAVKSQEEAWDRLQELRLVYLRAYPTRTYSASARDNGDYDKLLDSLRCDDLVRFQEAAGEQALAAVEHFKDDFIYKIRSAIKEALQRKDELNRIIDKLDFGKDKYQFVITKNKGADGRYYDMFMADSLAVNPRTLGQADSQAGQSQLNLFTMSHENDYGELMDELISIFIPPENATQEELEEARRNMEKYADYRTYLSFDMQQIIHGEETIKIRLSRMIKKNSGGEGQNPLYVALLASFAQAYRVNLSPKVLRNPTIRLVVLDEAFSKMDAEKVASCIELIRGLGFQAIISATNDKIQNYLENVDKTFVYANPNKKSISIQEFEKNEFDRLSEELSEEE